jgi:hypothetical protein
MKTIQEICESMRGAIAELEREADGLRAALAEIERQQAAAEVPATRTAERRVADARPAKPRGRRHSHVVNGAAPVKVLLAGQLERMLEDNREGLSAAEIAKRAGAAYGQVSDLLAELQDAGKVHRTGQRRGTRWHALSDEEWIARRAAELEHRTKLVASG